MTREEAINTLGNFKRYISGGGVTDLKANEAIDMAIEALQAEKPTGYWISRIDTGTWMLECSVCGCRVQEEPYRIAVGENATRCPYCGAELGLGGYLYDEYADRPSQRGEDE